MPEILAGLGLLAALALLVLTAVVHRSDLGRARVGLHRAERVIGEARRMHRIGQQILEAQQLSESGVSVGAELVRQVHRGIAAIPFGILEAIPVTRDTTRLVRATHDLIAGAVYDSLQAVNQEVGAQLRRQLGSGGGPRLPMVDGPARSARARPKVDPSPSPGEKDRP